MATKQITAPTTVTVSIPPTEVEIAALREAGRGSIVHHPRAGSLAGRKQIAQGLRAGGLEPDLVRSLGYSTRGPAKPEKAIVAPVSAPVPVEPVEPAQEHDDASEVD